MMKSLTQDVSYDHTLTPEQKLALEMLQSGENVFLTGGAGSGKSYVVREFMKELSSQTMPVLASTGAAAVLLGGRTFHSFFGLGIMEGGPDATYQRASQDLKTLKRISQVEGVIIDEISMISGEAFMIAEALAQKARGSSLPWGGMRMIAVGDFAQLPPITSSTMNSKKKDWSFLNSAWQQSGFQICELRHNQRVKDSHFLDVLSEIRFGKLTQQGAQFLHQHTKPHDEAHSGTRLFPRRQQSDFYNEKKLAEIPHEEKIFEAIFFGEERFVQSLKKASPVPETLKLKKGCRVIFLKNDPQKRWVNGTRGIITEMDLNQLTIKKDYGREVTVEKDTFSLLDSEGQIKASVIQFPLNLAYATTIHKSQGATLDELWCDLGSLWEPGHAYVALSRLREPSGLHIVRWSPRSIIVDPQVVQFYQKINEKK